MTQNASNLYKVLLRGFLTALPITYMGVIWYLSSRPSKAVIDLGTHDGLIKESLHLVEFGILYALWILALLAWGRFNLYTNRALVGLSLLYALIDELHQSFVPERSATLIDLVKDAIGVAVIWLIVKRTYFHSPSSRIGRWIKQVTEQLKF